MQNILNTTQAFFKFFSLNSGLRVRQVYSQYHRFVLIFFRSNLSLFPLLSLRASHQKAFFLSNCIYSVIKYCVLKHLFSDWIETVVRLWEQWAVSMPLLFLFAGVCVGLYLCACRFMHNDRFIISSSPSNERKRASERKRAIMTAGVTIDIWLRYWPSVRVCVADRKVKTSLPSERVRVRVNVNVIAVWAHLIKATERLSESNLV